MERWLARSPVTRTRHGEFWVHASPNYLFVTVSAAADGEPIRDLTRRYYIQLLQLVSDLGYPHLLRFWNYVPGINCGDGDEETYRQFCRGRAEGFDTHPRDLPAATGIGSHDNTCRFSALCGTAEIEVRHLENPRQVSAYRYPRLYGPRSPSFARATIFGMSGDQLLLVSGTSSIVNHETMHAGDMRAQIGETFRNIEQLVCPPNDCETQPRSWNPLAMRFYLRQSGQLDEARQAYRHAFAEYPDPAFLHADICRRELSMEIEGVFHNRIHVP